MLSYTLRRASYSLLVWLSLGSAVIVSCAKEDKYPTPIPQQTESKDEFKLLSVQSYETGQQIEVSLDMLFEDNEARALSFDEREETGELSEALISSQEKMHLFIRKEGDNASHAAATLTWEGRRGKKLFLKKFPMALPQGYNINPGERWYVMGIVGGELDPRTKTVKLGGDSDAITLANRNTVDMPYSFGWKPLTIEKKNTTTIGATTLKPRGSLLRLHLYSDLIEDKEVRGFQLTSNALRAKGSFAPFAIDNNASQVGQEAVWTATSVAHATPITWSYNLGGNSVNLTAGSGYNPQRTIYIWAMPSAVAESESSTQINLLVQSPNSDASESLTTYSKQGHRNLKEGSSYRLSNVLSTTLMISEVYYQFAPKGSNPNQPDDNKVYSIVEIYNPTASEVDLTDYALVRTAYDLNVFGYATAGNKFIYSAHTLQEAGYLPLSTVVGSTEHINKFPRTTGIHYSDSWHKSIYGTPSLKIGAGKTILIGAGGYVATEHKPSANIELFDPSTYNGASTQSLEKRYLPRAGMQADSAYLAGYSQFMVAIDNGNRKGNDPNPSARGGVLQLGNTQGVALVKASPNASGRYDYAIVDISTPIGSNAQKNAQFLRKLTEAGINHNYRAEVSYSIVRRPGIYPHNEYNPDEWVIAETENDGIKSLGTRDYVAGLTPYKAYYKGYTRENNPKGNPFWGNKTAPQHNKAWGTLPETGTNLLPNYSNMEGRTTKARVANGSATREDPNDVFTKSFDGNYSTRFWGGGPLPVRLTYNFGEPITLSHIRYHSWDSKHSIDSYDINVTYADGTNKLITMPNLGSPHRSTTEITWQGISDKPIKTVQFIVKTVQNGSTTNAVSFYEMEFYKISEKYVAPPSIFKDLACTELKEGVTYEQIMAVENQFYREIARKIHQGSYPREFRIEDYKAWTNPSYQQKLNKNQFPYSLHDNPTGMYFNEGEEVVVLVGDTKGHNISLSIYEPEINRSATGGGDNYPLKPGFNKFRVSRRGLGYILYHVDEIDINRTNHPNIRVHFPEGVGFVNGYFDTEKPSLRNRWQELLGKAKAKHFDVLGKYAHLTFNTGAFRANTPDGIALMANYDKLVFGEMMLMGVAKNKARTFRNRMLFMRKYERFMDAFYNRTAYNFGEDNSAVAKSLTHVPTQNEWTWGAAHEVGHMNQTVGLNWGGMIEVTNNIHSFYVEHVIFKDSSRLLRPERSGSNAFDPAWNALLETDRTFTSESRGTNSLIAFVQLQLYLGNVRGDTPDKKTDFDGFYPRLYENLRDADYSARNNRSNPRDNGFQQLEFTYHACRAAGYDLTPFFERWGFYRNVDNVEYRNVYNQPFYITVTAEMVKSVKERIKALNLPAIPNGVAFEYITPNNQSLFANPQAVVKGSVSKNGTSFTLTNWQKVVAWEIRDAQNRLLHTSTGGFAYPGGTYTVSYASWQDGSNTLYAIDAKGVKTKAYPAN